MEVKTTKENWKEIYRLTEKAYKNAKGRDFKKSEKLRLKLVELREKKGYLI